jgi:hypothetical protein
MQIERLKVSTERPMGRAILAALDFWVEYSRNSRLEEYISRGRETAIVQEAVSVRLPEDHPDKEQDVRTIVYGTRILSMSDIHGEDERCIDAFNRYVDLLAVSPNLKADVVIQDSRDDSFEYSMDVLVFELARIAAREVAS